MEVIEEILYGDRIVRLIRAAVAKEHSQLGFRYLSKNEVFKIGSYLANVAREGYWILEHKEDWSGGIISGFKMTDPISSGYMHLCNPWVKFEEMKTEVIPPRVAQALTILKPLFDNVYIASAGNAEESMGDIVTRAYLCPVGVGVAGKNVALLARWGSYPKFLDQHSRQVTLRNIFWKLDESLHWFIGL